MIIQVTKEVIYSKVFLLYTQSICMFPVDVFISPRLRRRWFVLLRRFPSPDQSQAQHLLGLTRLCTMSVGHQFSQRHWVSHDSRLFLRMRRTLSILSASLAPWRSWQNLAHFYRDPGGKYCKRLGPRFSRSRGASSLVVGGPREGLRVYLSRGHGGDLEKGG